MSEAINYVGWMVEKAFIIRKLDSLQHEYVFGREKQYQNFGTLQKSPIIREKWNVI